MTANMPEHMTTDLPPTTDNRARAQFLAADLTRRAATTGRTDLTVTTPDLAGDTAVTVTGPTGSAFTTACWADGWVIYYSHNARDESIQPSRMLMPNYDLASAYMYGLMTAMAPAPF